MRKMIFALSATFLLITVATKPRDDNSGAHVALALANNAAQIYSATQTHQRSVPSAKNFLKNIFWLDKNNPNFMMLSAFKKDIAYYISTLEDHIKILEAKIAVDKNGFTSWAAIKTLFLSTLAGLFGYGWYQIKNNPGLLISYIDNRLHAEVLVSSAILTVLFGGLAGYYFNKACTYKERMIARLARDKKLLAAFEKEKIELSKNHVINAALKLIDAVAAATV